MLPPTPNPTFYLVTEIFDISFFYISNNNINCHRIINRDIQITPVFHIRTTVPSFQELVFLPIQLSLVNNYIISNSIVRRRTCLAALFPLILITRIFFALPIRS